MSGKFIEVNVWQGKVGKDKFFPSYMECQLHREAGRMEVLKFSGKLNNADPALVSLRARLCVHIV